MRKPWSFRTSKFFTRVFFIRFSSLTLSLCLASTLISCGKQTTEEENTNPVAEWTRFEPPPGDNISQGLWWLYHMQYDRARKSFSDEIHSNRKNPLGYFYRTAADWWQLAQDIGREQPKLASQFEDDYLETVRVSRAAFEQSHDPKTQAGALLCEGGAKGLRGRWSIMQNDWGKAYSLGKTGDRLLKKSLALDPELNEACLGLGIYDYYTATLPGVMGFLAKFLMHGDRARGLEELNRTVAKARYARVEATLFLIQINIMFEKKPTEALKLARQLKKEFPHSPVMHATEINTLYETKDWKEGMKEAQDFIEKCQKQTPFYSPADLKTGYYYAGLGAFLGNHDASTCLDYMNRIISQEKEPSQWVSFAYLRRGQAYDVLGKRELAKADYKSVLTQKDVWNFHKKAEDGLKHLFSFSN